MASSTASASRRGSLPASLEAPPTGLTIYGCEPDEAALFREMAARFNVIATTTAAPVSPHNLTLAVGNRCISVAHKTRVTDTTLGELRDAGVEHIITRSIGTNHLDVNYAESLGISVQSVAYSPDSVADYTLMLILMAVRNAKSIVRRTDLHDYRLPELRGKELRDLTIGVIGTGRIGTAVIDRLAGFGCRVLAHDRNPERHAQLVPLDALLEQSDVVTLHLPLTRDTHHLLDRRRIERLKAGSYIVNTGRGPLLDTQALLRALESGKLAGAALDVLEEEEGIFYSDCRNRSIEHAALLRLQELPNVLVSPHTAYYTTHSLHDTVEQALVACVRFESRRRHG